MKQIFTWLRFLPVVFLKTKTMEMEKQLKEDFKKKFPLSKLIFSFDYPNLRMKHPDFSFSRINGKSVIHTRSVKNYSPYFKLTVTSDSESLNTI